MRLPRLAVPVFVLSAALAACGESADPGGQQAQAPAPKPAAPAAAAPAPAPSAPPAAAPAPTPAPAEPAATASADGAMPAGDAARGATVFNQCKACHVLEPGQNRVGPTLHGIIGRKAGTVEGFAYSDANKNSGVTWTEPVMFEYLENPREFMPGTKMAFAGLKKPQDRADVIAYIKANSQ